MTAATAQVYRHFAAVDTPASPLSARVAVALAESGPALRAIDTAPARARHPARILAALYDLALDGRAPALARAYAAGDAEAAAEAAIETMVAMGEVVVAVAARRKPQTVETGRCAALVPAIAEAAHQLGMSAVGLVDVGSSPGLNLHVDRVGVTYGNGQRLGDPASPVQLSASVVGSRPLPTRGVPQVVARIGLDRDPVDLTDAADARWLRACVGPDQAGRAAELAAAVAVAKAAPPLLLAGDAAELLPDALARVPADALPVLLTTWALSRLTVERRLRFRQRLDGLAAGRAVAWVSVEGVGVAPSVPTLGDRPASGHSIIGLAVSGPAGLQTEALGRCWSRGRTLSWLQDS